MSETQNAGIPRRLPIVAGNWKMNKGPAETRRFFAEFLPASAPREDRSLWFFPPAASIEAAAEATRGRADIAIGAQNIHWEKAGAFTGETSATIAREAGARIVLIGHSERRHIFGETDEHVAKKVRAALDAGLHVLVCVGEKLEERERGDLETVLAQQLDAALAVVADTDMPNVSLAYEPVWAIGTGVNATPADAAAAHAFLRQRTADTMGDDVARALAILYGGSVNPDNAAALLAAEHVDGLLIGGASLNPSSLARIAEL